MRGKAWVPRPFQGRGTDSPDELWVPHAPGLSAVEALRAWGTDVYVEPPSVPHPDTGWGTRPYVVVLGVPRSFQEWGTDVYDGWPRSFSGPGGHDEIAGSTGVPHALRAWGTDVYVEILSVPHPDTGWGTRRMSSYYGAPLLPGVGD